MNLRHLYGFLKGIKFLVLVLLLFSFGYKSKSTEGKSKLITLKFRSITGDTVLECIKSKFVITVINEPSCTGCKINLLKYMKSKKIDQGFILDWKNDIVTRKTYKKYVQEYNSKIMDFYSLSNKNSEFMLNDSLIKLTNDHSPYQIWISKSSESIVIKKISYEEIFESTSVKNSFKNSLERC